MSLRFRYKRAVTKQPVWTLGGRNERSRPIAAVTVIGPNGTVVLNAHVDPAADDTVFNEDVAATIGLDLSQAPVGEAMGVGSGRVLLRYAEVTLRLANGGERREWRGRVGFASVRLNSALLGFAGCLQFFTATFHGDREEVELEINSLYPGI